MQQARYYTLSRCHQSLHVLLGRTKYGSVVTPETANLKKHTENVQIYVDLSKRK